LYLNKRDSDTSRSCQDFYGAKTESISLTRNALFLSIKKEINVKIKGEKRSGLLQVKGRRVEEEKGG